VSRARRFGGGAAAWALRLLPAGCAAAPAPLQHVVLVKLQDPAEAPRLVAAWRPRWSWIRIHDVAPR
jgi:hypothetical protein